MKSETKILERSACVFPFTLHSSLFTCLVLATTIAFGADLKEDSEYRFRALISELRCLVCQNQTIAESNAPLAADLREQVRAQIESGRSNAEIIEFVTARYGDFVLYRPPFKRSTWLLWLGPFAVLALAALIAVVFVRRSRRTNYPSPQPSPLERGEGVILPLPRGGEVALRCAGPQPRPFAGRELPLAVRESPGSPGEGAALAASAVPPVLVAAAAIGTLVFASVWYVLAGSWRTQVLVDLATTNPVAAEQAAFEDVLTRLQKHVRDKPDDADGWAWLGRSYMKRERYSEAAAALARANELTASRDADLLVEEGEALAYAQGRSLAGVPATKFEQALALAPDHPRALWFAGLVALHTGDERAALAHWERLATQDLPEDVHASLEQSLAELRQRTGIKAVKPAQPALNAPLELKLEINIVPELLAEVRPGDTLFVYAQQPSAVAGGGNAPLAVRRFNDVRFPLHTMLDDSHSMMPARKLSGADRWRLVARLSRSGNALPQPGDLEGELLVSRDQSGRPHNLTISRQRP